MTEVDARTLAASLSASLEVLRVQHDNGAFLTAPWPADGMPSRPYAVLLADHKGFRTLAFDFDVKNGGVDAVERDVSELVTLLGSCPHLVARSSRSGGIHVFVPSADPVSPTAARRLALVLRNRLPTLDVTPLCNPTAGAIRPPGSPHRDGSRSELVTDPDKAHQVLVERASLDEVFWFFRRVGVRLSAPLLPRHLFMALRFGSSHPYNSRSELVAALAVSALNRGGEPGLVWLGDQLRDGRNHLVASLRIEPRPGGGPRDVEKLIGATFASARRFVAHRPAWSSVEARQAIDAVADAVTRHRWRGQAGLTDLAVLCALVGLGQRIGSPVVNASERQLAELASCTRATARRSCQRLCVGGWIRLHAGPTPTLASTWRLTVPDTASSTTAGDGLDPDPVGQPLFAHAGLGRSAARVWACWREGITSTGQMALRTGLHPGTVRRAVTRLTRCGLRPDDALDPDQSTKLRLAAEEVGVWQWWVQLCARHLVERALFQQFLSSRRVLAPPLAA